MHGSQWRSEYAIGHPIIDTHHMALLELIDALRLLSQVDIGSAAVSVAVADLSDYVYVHFAFEESFMQENAQAEYEFHRQEHEGMRKKLGGVLNLLQTKGGMPCSELADLLEQWFREHVTQVDSRLKPYVLPSR